MIKNNSFSKNDLQWMANRKELGERTFAAVILLGMMFILSIDTGYSINIFSFETIILSMILVSFTLISEFFVVRAIKNNPSYASKPRKTFRYAPARSPETVLFLGLIIISLLTTLLFGIFTDTLVESFIIAATIFAISLPINSVLLHFWINRLPS